MLQINGEERRAVFSSSWRETISGEITMKFLKPISQVNS